ncbi:hypothetical protein H5410_005276 [Solanum commersonii]|uniref:Uncharacterized protein n=1 Tax=Solanum commersonii TaxID=4109 RepID=A0A9J6A6S8_SOLCO|nr:hypothetical protein H5410_005276 [Solanum commersonii]
MFGHEIDLENDKSDEEDEYDMLDIYFDKLAKEEDLSSRQQRSGNDGVGALMISVELSGASDTFFRGWFIGKIMTFLKRRSVEHMNFLGS